MKKPRSAKGKRGIKHLANGLEIGRKGGRKERGIEGKELGLNNERRTKTIYTLAPIFKKHITGIAKDLLKGDENAGLQD